MRKSSSVIRLIAVGCWFLIGVSFTSVCILPRYVDVRIRKVSVTVM